MIQGYQREDPKSEPQLAVPVSITMHILNSQWIHSANCPQKEAIADLINVAFYYLLRVGEYTKPRSHKTNTIPFSVQDITFRRPDGAIIPNNSELATLLTAAEATIRIPNQKNGVKGQCIHHDCTDLPHSPVKSLARRVHHILSNKGTSSTNIFCYTHPLKVGWQTITSQHINNTLKQAAGEIGLYLLGYTFNDISSHSLRAGGAMAMHLNGVDANTIRKMGRWKSDTFLMYIHEQISAFATGVSTKMSNAIPFRHIAGPTIIAQP
jgi:Phage integrase family